MAVRLYLVPVVGAGVFPLDGRRPKYFADGTLATSWSGMDYGMEPWMLVAADLSVADDAMVVGQADAFGLPFDLSSNLTGGQVTTVQAKLEAINLPADWVTTGLTWQQVVRIVLGIFAFMQRFIFLNGPTRVFGGAVTLATTISQLPGLAVTHLTQAADAMGIDRSSITGASTLRTVLHVLGAQLQARPFTFLNGVTI